LAKYLIRRQTISLIKYVIRTKSISFYDDVIFFTLKNESYIFCSLHDASTNIGNPLMWWATHETQVPNVFLNNTPNGVGFKEYF
jgi:hypothetical protein